jgi:hypothetical protein
LRDICLRPYIKPTHLPLIESFPQSLRNHWAGPVLRGSVCLDRLSARRPPVLAAALCAALLAVTAAPAAAAPALNWSTATIPGAGPLTGVSCASETLCVAVDEAGNALVSTDPGAGTSATWSRREIDPGKALSAVSCASNTLCVAVDESYALISTNPAAGASATWSRVETHSAGALSGVSCASGTLCVAVDKAGDALVSTNPAAGASATWSRVEIDSGKALSSVSCAAGLPCVAVDGTGRAWTSSEPAGAWHPRQIDNSALTAVSCGAAPAGVCVAVDEAGEALASANVAAPGPPGGPGPTWSVTPVEEPGLGPPTAVSCAAAGLCVAVNRDGDAYVSDDPTAAAPSWEFHSIDPPRPLTGVSCVAEGLCAAVDRAGQALIGRVPAPVAATGTPSAVGETAATLTGTVNPEDATLTSCRFEYGLSEAYGQSAPCAAGGIAGGATQAVSTTLSGLAASTTYHYRLVASSASGTSVGPGATFKTTAPPLVQPHPSINGIPALGQKLTCKSGVGASGSDATLAFAWLRDTHAIAGANGSTYTVASADVTHHLQCRVTATNVAGSASASSAFVTVPAGGLGSVSETHVGTPRVTGTTVSVPVTCSAQAAGSCTIVLRLTVVETLRGGRPIAVAARRRSQRVTVTIGASTVHLGAGQQRTVTVALNGTGRRLLARLHKLTARLSVSGTVVGAIGASLRSATVTLGGAGKVSSHKASSHKASSRKASRRRR